MQFKFITLNLWEGGNLFEEIIHFFKKEKPDIVALQEAHTDDGRTLAKKCRSLNLLKEELNFEYLAFSPAFTHNRVEGRIVQGNAILSRLPIISHQTTFYDIPYNENYVATSGNFLFVPRNLQHVLIQVDNKQMNLFNTHGIWGFDGEDNERRLKMGETIVNKIRGKKNIVLAGDFNLSENTQTIENIERHLRNVFKGELETTFNMKRKTGKGFAEAVVDMVFIDENIKVITHYCPRVDISDHLPLVCLLEI